MANQQQTHVTEKNLNTHIKSNDKPTNQALSRYGWCCFRPSWLQFFNSPIWLTLILGLYQFIYQAISGFKGSTVSTLEKGFNLTATDIGVITIFFNVPNAICGLIFSFWATHGHKGKWMTASLLVVGIGLLIYALPHWIIGSYQILNHVIVDNNRGQCHPIINQTLYNITSNCRRSTGSNALYYFVFSLSQFIIGCGVCTLRTIGWSYIDDNVSPASSPLYVGFVLTMFGLGPAAGYVIGGVIVNTFVYWPLKPPVGLNSDSPQWLGAWWLGYVASGALLLILIIPMAAFPHHLPNYATYKAERDQLAVGKSKVDPKYGQSFKEFFPAVKQLLTNIPFMATVASVVVQSIMISGLSTFLPKYIESQFGLRAADSSVYVGIILVIGLIGGMIIGGGIMNAKKMGALAIAKFALIASILGSIAAAFFFISKCDNPKLAGVYLPYTNNANTSNHMTGGANLLSACNQNCHCQINTFNPICDIENNITYFSPCHAGCLSKAPSQIFKEVYYNCSCIQGPRLSTATFDAVKNYCPRNCTVFIPFLILLGILVFLSYLNLVPATQLIIRCVPDSQKSFALSIEFFFVQLIGTIPGPLLIGYFIDTSCLLWNEERGERKFCWLYDNASMTYWIGGLACLLRTAATVFSFVAWYYLRKDVMNDKTSVDNIVYGNPPLQHTSSRASVKPHRISVPMTEYEEASGVAVTSE